ncbi:MAG TPA: PEP-CTERM sorting domain-containing protein [Kiritimatiellia bacterium]|nr:PEP-CTERM sorting domain-containing protein [Kiritimatiellia bacterium]
MLALALAALSLSSGAASGATVVLHQELFDADPGGTYAVLAGSAFSGLDGFAGGVGNTVVDLSALVGATGGGSPSGAGSFEGSFAAQGVPSPETGTLRITDPGFLTDYASAYSGYSTYFLGFAFYASVLPADMMMIIGNDNFTYVYNVAPQITSAGAWNDVFIDFSSGWLGSGSSIPNPLAGMTYIDLTWSRSGTGAQQFLFDDFTLFGSDAPPPVGSAVPEPGTGLLMFGVMVVYALRRMYVPGAHALG